MNAFSRTALYSLLAVTLLAFATGCRTTEPENASARPWNSPKSWEGGLPTTINEGR